MLSQTSSIYSDSAISGMFHPHKTGCNDHVSVHRYCDREHLGSCAYMFECKHGNKARVSNIFQRRKQIRSEGKIVICNVYSYSEEESSKDGITVSPLSHTVKATGLCQTTIVRILYATRDD